MNKKGYIDNPEGKRILYFVLIIGLVLMIFIGYINIYNNKDMEKSYKNQVYSFERNNTITVKCDIPTKALDYDLNLIVARNGTCYYNGE